ncbi:GGDEF domain-containing protein [Psychrobacillus sp.]|uniref:GGDEF domain-containing protein n=1 Tax=Psychrobacillus sp. TaxID=1871623 RepID=UPI0028BD6D9D|nr:GGDEF domain-containing protein [Psychrobacillus sp.]
MLSSNERRYTAMKDPTDKLLKLAADYTNKELEDISFSLFEAFIVMQITRNGDIKKVSDRFLTTFNYSIEEIELLKLEAIIGNDINSYFLPSVSEGLEKKQHWSGRLYLQNKQSEPINSMVHVIVERHSADYLLFIAPMNNVSEHERWKELALTDELTGLPNKRKFQEWISYQLEKNARIKSTFGLLFIDIDEFKLVNDVYGHVVGDKFLIECAVRFMDVLKGNDQIFRKSGDEFLIIIENVEQMDEICDAIHKQFAKPFHIDSKYIPGSVSIGSAVYPENGKGEESLMNFADRAMYEKKKENKLRGKNDKAKNLND